MSRLQGKVAIITGSNSGIGRAIALAYAYEGAKVICANRSDMSKNPDEADKEVSTSELIKRRGGESEFVKMEVIDSQSVNTVVQDVAKRYGRIDVLVNNAGDVSDMATGLPFWELPDDVIQKNIDINLMGYIRVTRAVLAIMVKQTPDGLGERGRLIHMGSVFGARGFSNAAVYSATKAGIVGLNKVLAVECAPHRVLSNVISPGTVVTNMTRGLEGPVDDMLKARSLIGYGAVKDIAGPAVFLASGESKWMTGTEIFVDGGYTAN